MIPWAQPCLGQREQALVREALESTWISDGAFVAQFEKSLSVRMGARHVCTTSNGTTALHLALLGLGVGPGDEVIVPGYTFVAPANVAIACGAKPVFVDVDPKTWCIDPLKVADAITPRTKAIVAVHVYGNVADVASLRKIAPLIPIVEDAAEAVFSQRDGMFAGTLGAVGCFSFQATKTITTGEGGAVATWSDVLADKMRTIRNHGMSDRRYWHTEIGFNFRLTNMQAAIGCAQLEQLQDFITDRALIFEQYRQSLQDADVQLQHFEASVMPVVWATALTLGPSYGERDDVIEQMKTLGVETRPGFYPFQKMPPYEWAPTLPVSTEISRRMISLPMWVGLSAQDIEYACASLKGLRR